MSLIPALLPSELEKMLEYLPPPTDTFVSVREGSERLDYSSLIRKMKEDNPHVRALEYISNPETVIFRFERLEKALLLGLYLNHYNYLRGLETRDEEIPYDHRKLQLEIEKVEWNISKTDLRDYKIPCDEAVFIRVTPNEVLMEYFGNEPEFVTKVREALEGTKAKVSVVMNPYEHTCPHTKD